MAFIDDAASGRRKRVLMEDDGPGGDWLSQAVARARQREEERRRREEERALEARLRDIDAEALTRKIRPRLWEEGRDEVPVVRERPEAERAASRLKRLGDIKQEPPDPAVAWARSGPGRAFLGETALMETRTPEIAPGTAPVLPFGQRAGTRTRELSIDTIADAKDPIAYLAQHPSIREWLPKSSDPREIEDFVDALRRAGMPEDVIARIADYYDKGGKYEPVGYRRAASPIEDVLTESTGNRFTSQLLSGLTWAFPPLGAIELGLRPGPTSGPGLAVDMLEASGNTVIFGRQLNLVEDAITNALLKKASKEATDGLLRTIGMEVGAHLAGTSVKAETSGLRAGATAGLVRVGTRAGLNLAEDIPLTMVQLQLLGIDPGSKEWNEIMRRVAFLSASAGTLFGALSSGPRGTGKQLRDAAIVGGGTYLGAQIAGDDKEGAAQKSALAVASGSALRLASRFTPPIVGRLGVREEIAPIWESGLRETLAEKMPARATPQQIRGIMKSGGVKEDEVEWTGLGSWLDAQDGPVTKQQVLDYLDKNDIQVEERLLREDAPLEPEPLVFPEPAEVRDWYSFETANEYDEWLESRDPNASTTTDSTGRFTISLRDDGKWILYDSRTGFEDTASTYHSAQAIANSIIRNEWREKTGDISPRFDRYRTQGGEPGSYKELLLTLPNAQYAGWWKSNRSSLPRTHWSPHGMDNVVAHIRFDERAGLEGERVLFINEIQSDWHQAGRMEGYQRPLPEFEVKVDVDNYGGQPRWILSVDSNDPGFVLVNRPYWHEPTVEDIMDFREIVRERWNAEQAYKTPAAPFSKNWEELALKRIIRYAADNGFDAVALARGEMLHPVSGGNDPGVRKVYNTKLPIVLAKVAKQHGLRPTTIRHDSPSFFVEPSNEAMIAKIRELAASDSDRFGIAKLFAEEIDRLEGDGWAPSGDILNEAQARVWSRLWDMPPGGRDALQSDADRFLGNIRTLMTKIQPAEGPGFRLDEEARRVLSRAPMRKWLVPGEGAAPPPGAGRELAQAGGTAAAAFLSEDGDLEDRLKAAAGGAVAGLIGTRAGIRTIDRVSGAGHRVLGPADGPVYTPDDIVQVSFNEWKVKREKGVNDWGGDIFLSGVPVEIESLPQHLYHVTVAASKIEADGVIRPSTGTDEGGLGQEHKPLAAYVGRSPLEAEIIAHELLHAHQVASGAVRKLADIDRMVAEDERLAGLRPGALKEDANHWKRSVMWPVVQTQLQSGESWTDIADAAIAAGREPTTDSLSWWIGYKDYLSRRERHGGPMNPVFTGLDSDHVLKNPRNVAIYRIPRENLYEMGGVVTSHTGDVLSEVVVYAPIPIRGADRLSLEDMAAMRARPSRYDDPSSRIWRLAEMVEMLRDDIRDSAQWANAPAGAKEAWETRYHAAADLYEQISVEGKSPEDAYSSLYYDSLADSDGSYLNSLNSIAKDVFNLNPPGGGPPGGASLVAGGRGQLGLGRELAQVGGAAAAAALTEDGDLEDRLKAGAGGAVAGLIGSRAGARVIADTAVAARKRPVPPGFATYQQWIQAQRAAASAPQQMVQAAEMVNADGISRARAAVDSPHKAQAFIRRIGGSAGQFLVDAVNKLADPASNISTELGREVLAATLFSSNFLAMRRATEHMRARRKWNMLDTLTGEKGQLNNVRRAAVQAGSGGAVLGAGLIAEEAGIEGGLEAGVVGAAAAVGLQHNIQRRRRFKNRLWDDVQLKSGVPIPNIYRSGVNKFVDILQNPMDYILSPEQVRQIAAYNRHRKQQILETNAEIQAAGGTPITFHDNHGILQFFDTPGLAEVTGRTRRELASTKITPGFSRKQAPQLQRELGDTFREATMRPGQEVLRPWRDPFELMVLEERFHDQIRSQAKLVANLKNIPNATFDVVPGKQRKAQNWTRQQIRQYKADKKRLLADGWNYLPGIDNLLFHPDVVAAVRDLLLPTRGRNAGPVALADNVTNILRQAMFTGDLSAWTMQGAMLAINDPFGTILNSHHLVGATVLGKRYFEWWVEHNRDLWEDFTKSGGVPGFEHSGIEKDGLSLSRVPGFRHIEERGFESFLPIHRALMWRNLTEQEHAIRTFGWKGDPAGLKRAFVESMKMGPFFGAAVAAGAIDTDITGEDWMDDALLLALGASVNVGTRVAVQNPWRSGASRATIVDKALAAKQTNRTSGAFNRAQYGISAKHAQLERILGARSPALMRNTIILTIKALTDFGPEGAMARYYLVKTAALMGAGFAMVEAMSGGDAEWNPLDPASVFSPLSRNFMQADLGEAGRLAPSNPNISLIRAFLRTDAPAGTTKWRFENWDPVLGLRDWFVGRAPDLAGPLLTIPAIEAAIPASIVPNPVDKYPGLPRSDDFRRRGKLKIGGTQTGISVPAPLGVRAFFETGLASKTRGGQMAEPITGALGFKRDPSYNKPRESLLGIAGTFVGLNPSPQSIGREFVEVKTGVFNELFPSAIDENGDGVIDYRDADDMQSRELNKVLEKHERFQALKSLLETPLDPLSPQPVQEYFEAIGSREAIWDAELARIDEQYRGNLISEFDARKAIQKIMELRDADISAVRDSFGKRNVQIRGLNMTVAEYLDRNTTSRDRLLREWYAASDKATKFGVVDFKLRDKLREDLLKDADPKDREYVLMAVDAFSNQTKELQVLRDYDVVKKVTRPYFEIRETVFDEQFRDVGIFAAYDSWDDLVDAVEALALELNVSSDEVWATLDDRPEVRAFNRVVDGLEAQMRSGNQELDNYLIEWYERAPLRRRRGRLASGLGASRPGRPGRPGLRRQNSGVAVDISALLGE